MTPLENEVLAVIARKVVSTEGFCVFLFYMPSDDICSTYTQTLASSKTYIGICIAITTI